MTREEKNSFSNIILERAETLKTDHLDAMITYCEEMQIELEIAASLVNDVLRYRLQEDAQDLRYMPRSNNRLPI
jgi:hypothetical protein